MERAKGAFILHRPAMVAPPAAVGSLAAGASLGYFR
jgi:hypothetical protein